MLPTIIFLTELFILYFLSKNLLTHFQRNIFRFIKNKTLATYVFAFLFLPGTLIHELSHFIFAKLLFVNTQGISLIPKHESLENGSMAIMLGHVKIEKVDPFRRLLIGISPIVAGITLILGIVYFGNQREFFGTWTGIMLSAYAIFEIGNTMFSSREDLNGAWKVFVVAAIAAVAIYLLGVRISFENQTFFEVIKKANLYLLWPIVIDALFLVVHRGLVISLQTKEH